jgi:hypothetical protein
VAGASIDNWKRTLRRQEDEMTTSTKPVNTFSLIAIPALITLAITLLRLMENCKAGRKYGSTAMPEDREL